jgi:2-polyprenyl-3-methyl-5-hydroxy-6-metoxy-1,4-benzoquinol methylase
MTTNSRRPSNQEKAEADLDYFSKLYGGQDESGEPQQTRIDKLRDGFLVRLYRKYGQKPLEDSSVLDVGCGYGWLLDYFEGAKMLAGIDIAHHAVEVASKRKPQRFFKQGNLEQPIPFTQTFDLVLAINIIEHLEKPEAGISSITRACHSGSIVLVHMPTIANALTKWEYSKLYDSDPTHIYRPSGKTVRHLFEAQGFTTLRDSYLPHFPTWMTKIYPIHPAYLAVLEKR